MMMIKYTLHILIGIEANLHQSRPFSTLPYPWSCSTLSRIQNGNNWTITLRTQTYAICTTHPALGCSTWDESTPHLDKSQQQISHEVILLHKKRTHFLFRYLFENREYKTSFETCGRVPNARNSLDIRQPCEGGGENKRFGCSRFCAGHAPAQSI